MKWARFAIMACLMSGAWLFGRAVTRPAAFIQSAGSPATPSDVAKASEESLAHVCSAKNPPPCATPPRAISTVDPDYSDKARASRKEGTCVLSVVVEANGTAGHIEVVNGIGYGLDEKAIEAVKRWKFRPAMQEGKAVPVAIAVEISFHLYHGGSRD